MNRFEAPELGSCHRLLCVNAALAGLGPPPDSLIEGGVPEKGLERKVGLRKVHGGLVLGAFSPCFLG